MIKRKTKLLTILIAALVLTTGIFSGCTDKKIHLDTDASEEVSDSKNKDSKDEKSDDKDKENKDDSKKETEKEDKKEDKDALTKEVVTNDDLVSIKIPDNWDTIDNPEQYVSTARLIASDGGKLGTYFVEVGTITNDMSGISNDELYEYLSKNLPSTISDPEFDRQPDVKIDGYDAIRVFIKGKVQNQNIKYCYTIINRGEKGMTEIGEWTHESFFDLKKDLFLAIADSAVFKD